MNRLVRRRERLIRVREVQHMLAVSETAKARDQVAQIADNGRRLAMVRAELFGVPGMTTGAALATHRELAGRLEVAGRQLEGALFDAKRRVERREIETTLADREREIAERLKSKALRAALARAEAKLAALPRARRQKKDESEL